MVERTKVRQLNQLVMAAQAAEFLGDSLSYVHRATGAIVGLRQMETKNHIASLLGLRRGRCWLFSEQGLQKWLTRQRV
jgi:hypothetical protein